MLGTSAFLIVFRVVHIVSAVAWGGALFLFVVYVQPSVAAIAPAGAPFVRELLAKRRMVDGILLIAATTILGGALLYWHDWQVSGGLGDWIGSTVGLWLTIGGVAAVLAFLLGLFVTRPNVHRMLALGGRIAAAGDAPDPEDARELQAIQRRLRNAARTSLALVGVAAFAMSTARYW